MQAANRYKWAFFLAFITLLMIALAYLVSEKLIRHLDEKYVPAGAVIPLSSNRTFHDTDERCIPFQQAQHFDK